MLVFTVRVYLQRVVERQLLADMNGAESFNVDLEPSPSPAVLDGLAVWRAGMVEVPGCIAALGAVDD